MRDADPITDDEVRRFRDALDDRGALDELDLLAAALDASAELTTLDEPRSIRQPSPTHPARGLADRVRAWVHTAACWVVVWTRPTDERARF